jgi:protein-tyrosine sulfotransferase
MLIGNNKLCKRFDLKTLGILIVIGTIILNYLKIDQHCLNYFNNRKLPIVSTNATRDEPVLIIGGIPRSGAALLGNILNSLPVMSCKNIKFLAGSINTIVSWHNNTVEKMRLDNAGVGKDIIKHATASFLLEIITNNENSNCVFDNYALKHSKYISTLLPNSKFILMIRDARSTVHSISLEKNSVPGFLDKNVIKAFETWNTVIETMYKDCLSIGQRRCLPVYYEKLVTNPEYNLKRIFKFLQIKWNDVVLNHQKYIQNSIIVSDNIKKPLNSDSLYKWVNNIPQSVLVQLQKLAPMMKKLGYDIKSEKPKY